MYDICKYCKGNCCKKIKLTYISSNRRIYKNGALERYIAKNHSHFVREGKHWKCTEFDELNGLCKIYDKRPPLCVSFTCPKMIEILALVTKFPVDNGN